jgi:TolB-like protein
LRHKPARSWYFFWESRIKQNSGIQEAPVVAEQTQTTETTAQVTTNSDELTIAVLPFVNMSSDEEQEYFSDGITEEILNVLAKIDGLRVTSRSSAFALKGQNLDIPTVAERLGVGHVLEGSVRKAGNQVRVTAQLIRVADDSHLWSETYDRELVNIFAIQDEISTAIADALKVELDPDRSAYQAPTSNLQAYELYLRARELQSTRIIANLVSSMDLFQQALDLDPGFANASGQMAMSAILLASRRHTQAAGVTNEDAERLAGQTLELDPENSLALIVTANIANDRWQWVEPSKMLAKALESGGSEAAPEYWNGLFWLQAGFAQKALDFFEAAEAKDPLNANIWRWLSNANRALGHFERSAEYMDRAVQVDQGFPGAVVENLIAAGQTTSALAYFEEHSEGTEDQLAQHELLFNGDVEPALALMEPENYEGRAWLFQRAGRHKEAMEAVRLLNDGGLSTRAQIHMANYFWDPRTPELRRIPEFKAFIHEVGLLDFWFEEGFPPICRPVGLEDFECD